MRYLLVGNYGVGNFGDEALRQYFLAAYPQAQWHVLSAHPTDGELPRLPAGIHSLLSTRWWRTLIALRASDGLVFGGGTLFTDIESVRAPLLWWWHAFVCWLLRKPFFLAFQGVGPFRTRVGEWCARWTVAHAAFVSVRDAASFALVEPWKKNTNIIQACDPIFSLFTAQKIINDAKKLLVVIPRKNSSESFMQRVAALRAGGGWEGVHILSLQPDDRREQEVCRSIAHVLSLPDSVIVPVRSVEKLAAQVGAAGFVLSQRYHGALAALAMGVPFETVSQKEGDKLSSLAGMSASDVSGLLSDGERQLQGALFPEKSKSGRIEL
ncbi:MAG: polysaccharide pyruvyl transferase family protein [Candidatus Peribacteraceae bacterium]|nr:polysaccharide pyruvyl transferase family protein [Candidatus Peribacteraceae bacterium]MDD5742482.1 polysaccharide pyruvyl transferase family protein [Candidatus Peribacteraceae bacterium]